MKTIRLDEEAYCRLYSSKTDAGESFSSVVKRLVPIPGSLGAFLRFGEMNPACDKDRDELMEQATNVRSVAKENPWES